MMSAGTTNLNVALLLERDYSKVSIGQKHSLGWQVVIFLVK